MGLRKVKTKYGKVSYCVLIPSRRRSTEMKRLWNSSMGFLDHPSTYIGVYEGEIGDYMGFGKARMVAHGAEQNISIAREALKDTCLRLDNPQYYVMTDDIASFTLKSLRTLVRECHEWRKEHNKKVMFTGIHQIFEFFDKGYIEAATKEGLTSYEKIQFGFMCVPRILAKKFHYDDKMPVFEDKHLGMWLILNGWKSRVAFNAKFTKSRFVGSGGSGTMPERYRSQAVAMARLMELYWWCYGQWNPKTPWKKLMSWNGKDIIHKALNCGWKSFIRG